MMTAIAPLALAFSLTAPVNASEALTSFKKANEDYLGGQFSAAAKQYQEIVDLGYESRDLYFNVGNAHYRAGTGST